MSVAISRYEAPAAQPAPVRAAALQRGDGAAEIVFDRHGLARLYQRTPCRVLFPAPEPGDIPLAALLTTCGGLTGGDRLCLTVTAGVEARGMAATVAAEKIYRSLGPEAAVDIALRAEESAWLEWLPQETILFEGARLVRRIAIDAAPDARLLAAETLVFGRAARGERFSHGLLHEGWRVRVAGKLAWADTLRLEHDIAAQLDAPLAFAAAGAMASVVYIGPDAADHLPLARSLVGDSATRGGATVVNGLLLARFIGPRADALRRAVTRYVAGLRAAAAGLPAALPRLWQT
jgi:urease accessory protein